MVNIGDTLREARERHGLTIADCEVGTKIRGKYLRALEENEFDLIPGPTYVRGFLKSHANFVGLDGDHLVREYAAQNPAPREVGAFEESIRRQHQRGRNRESALLIVVTILALAVSTAVWSLLDGRRATASESGTVTATFAAAGTQPTYVEVREGSATGPTPFLPGNIDPASPVTVVVTPPIIVHVGDGSGLVLVVDGATVDIPSGRTDFTLEADGTITELTSGP